MKKSERSTPRVRVIWDEENLHQLEASKSPKQKITEPKTPYYAPDAVDGVVSPTPDQGKSQMDSAIHAEAIRHALFEVAAEEKASTSRQCGGGWISSEEDELDEMDRYDEGVENNQSRSFEEHRRKHYDEYRKAKLLGGEGDNEDDSGETASSLVGRPSTSGCSSGSGSSFMSHASSSLDKDMEQRASSS